MRREVQGVDTVTLNIYCFTIMLYSNNTINE
jgi:hypothetical protein